MNDGVASTHPDVDPAFKAALNTALQESEEHLDQVQHFMQETKRAHPEIGRHTVLNLVGKDQAVPYLDDQQIAERRAVLSVMRDMVCDAMQAAKTPKERVTRLIEIAQGGLHGSTFLGSDYHMWHFVDQWMEKSLAQFYRIASPQALREYKPAMQAYSRYAEMCEMASGAICEMIHAKQRAMGAKPEELRDSCYDWATEQYYKHYPSRRGHELTAQEEHWVTSQSKIVLQGLLEPYMEGIGGHIAPEMAAWVVLAAERHTEKLQSRASIAEGAPIAVNDNAVHTGPEVLQRTNATLMGLFEKYPDAALSADGLLAAWSALEKQMAPSKAANSR